MDLLPQQNPQSTKLNRQQSHIDSSIQSQSQKSLSIYYIENSFQLINFKNCPVFLTLAQLQDIVFQHFEIPAKDQQIFKIIENLKLFKYQNVDEYIFEQKISENVKINVQNEIELIVINHQIQSEADLKDLLIFQPGASNEIGNFCQQQIDMDAFLRNQASKDGCSNLQQKLQSSIQNSKIMNYENVNIYSSNFMESEDILEKFNFQKITNLSNFPMNQQWLTQKGIDIAKLQTYDQIVFQNFQKLKQFFRKFKGQSKDCLIELKNLQKINKICEALNNHFLSEQLKLHKNEDISQLKIDSQPSPIESLKSQFHNLKELSVQAVKLYNEGIQNLKTYQIHSEFQSEGKKYLSDIYYKEDQMNSFRDSLLRQYERIKAKVDQHFLSVNDKAPSQDMKDESNENNQAMFRIQSYDQKIQLLNKKLQDEIIDAKEPLIISLVVTIFEELKNFHKILRLLQKFFEEQSGQSQASQLQNKNEILKACEKILLIQDYLKSKQLEYSQYVDQVSGYNKDINQKIIVKIQDFKYQLSKDAITLKQFKLSAKFLEKKPVVQDEKLIQILISEIQKLRKDFAYLRKPSIVPRAYEASLSEMKRRKFFREGLNNYVQKLQKIIEIEKERRNSFIINHVQYLPSHFWPQLKELTPTLTLEGKAEELKFPDFKNCNDIKFDDQIFEIISGSSTKQENGQIILASNGQNIDEKQLEIIQEDLENHKSRIQAKEQTIYNLKSRMESKEQEISNLNVQIEKLNRTIKDLSQSQKMQIRFNEEKINKKQQELQIILKDKKCKNCAICLNGYNFDFKDQIDLITELNKELMKKQNENDEILQNYNKSNVLMSEVCQHNFQLLRLKTQDFLKSYDQQKQRFERKLMEVEDQLTLEAAKYNQIIKTRVKQQQDKIDEQKHELQEKQREIDGQRTENRQMRKINGDLENSTKSIKLDLKIAQKDLKIKDEKLCELKKEINELQKIKVDKIESIKKLLQMLQDKDRDETKLKESQEQLSAELKESQDEQQWLKKELESLSSVITAKNSEIQELQEKSQKYETQEKQLFKKLQEKQNEVKQLQEREQQLIIENQQLQDKIQNQQKDSQAIQNCLSEMKNDKQKLENDLIDCQKILRLSKINESNMKNEQESLLQQNESLKSQVTQLNNQISQQKNKLIDLQEQDLKGQAQEYEKEILKLQNENLNMQKIISNLDQSNYASIEKIVDFIGKYLFSDDNIQKIYEIKQNIRNQNISLDPFLNLLLTVVLNQDMNFRQNKINIMNIASQDQSSPLQQFIQDEIELKSIIQSPKMLQNLISNTLKPCQDYQVQDQKIQKKFLRLLFLPYQPGIYLGFILQSQDRIMKMVKILDEKTQNIKLESDLFDNFDINEYIKESLQETQQSQQTYQEELKDGNDLETKSNLSTPSLSKVSSNQSGQPQIKRVNIQSNLFLDMECLSKNMQVLLSNYEMHLIAQVSEIQEHTASIDQYGCQVLKLSEGTKYSTCKVLKVDHIVNFTTRILGNRSDNSFNDYSFTDYIFK